jgi:hypothetical protein
MAHQRTTSVGAADALKEPHSVSLKVLRYARYTCVQIQGLIEHYRLSRPSLAIQHPLPTPSPSSELAQAISPAASRAYPSASQDSFILSPVLTLPPAFGNAYVGETFACTLCANNELTEGDLKRIHGVKIEAEMKSPSAIIPLPVAFAEPAKDDLMGSLQGIVDYHLKEEGNHVLAVTITYSETSPTAGRVRTFRKLYQFVARPSLVVRTKIGALPKGWALEAQLENCGEDRIVLESVDLDAKTWCKATNLKWDKSPVLGHGDVQQVCFLIEQVGQNDDSAGRLVMGMMNITWRGAMGNAGSLSTGWLGTRAR